MEPLFNEILWRQFGAAIDMLGNAVEACPDHVWSAPARDAARHTEFWYIAFHALFFMDLCLSGSVEGFAPPPPFGLEELDPAGIIPEAPYTRNDVTKYVVHCHEKCHAVIHGSMATQPRSAVTFAGSISASANCSFTTYGTCSIMQGNSTCFSARAPTALPVG